MSTQTTRQEEEESSSEEDSSSSKKVFEDEKGDPIWFFLHKSISDWQRQNLINDIQSNGGIVQSTDSGVDTVLVDVKSLNGNKDALQLAYNAHSDPSKRRTWVEPMSFVSRCLKERGVRHRQPEPKGMGGSLGSERTFFTEEDDHKLAQYLAIRIPDNRMGGRRGNGVYKELYQAYLEDPEEYGWVARHTWQSWRNRYNKNVSRFNAMIDAYVKMERPERKQAYCLQRKYRGWPALAESGEEDEEKTGNLSKRRRIDFSPDSPQSCAKVRPPTTRKGKERAVLEDVNDTQREPSPFYEDLTAGEPGPSNRTPITTYDHRPSRQPRIGSPSHDPEPYTSQATLVAPRHQTQELESQQRAIPDLPSQQSRHSRVSRRETGFAVQQSRASSSHKKFNVSALLGPSIEVSGADARTKTVSTSSRHRPMARKVARRSRTPPESIVIAPSDPSYNDARLVPRSVEPSELLHLKPRRKEGTVIEHRGATSPLLEEANEDHRLLVETLDTQPSPDLIRETMEEEQDVENILVNNISGRSQATKNELQTRTKDSSSVNARDGSASQFGDLDSDDAQTDDRLRQPQIQARTQEPDVRPNEILRRFREATINTPRFSKGISVQPVPLSPAQADLMTTRQRRSAPVYSHNVFSGLSLTQQPRKPAANLQSQLRRGSTSSKESFPIAGTRASAAKRTRETEEKYTPYIPPVGTRAAFLIED